MRKLSAAALGVPIALAIVTSGCQHSENRHVKRSISAAEVTGTWRMTPESAEDIREAGGDESIDPARHELVLRSDQSCSFRTYSPSSDLREARPVLAECRWKLGTVGERAVLVDVEGDPPWRVYYYLGEGPDSRLELWQHLGDPDSWRYFAYRKVG